MSCHSSRIPITVITGGGTGIGAAIAKRLAQNGKHVLIVGRRLELLQQVANTTTLIQTVAADISTKNGREKVLQSLLSSSSSWVVQSLIHNAGVLEPVKPLLQMTEEEWNHHMNINLNAPLFLTQTLLPQMSGGSRILHISSGAAHNPYQGWGAYCVSKAGLHMMYQLLSLELSSSQNNIHVGSVRPGVVDTPMQDTVRLQDPSIFPNLSKFQQLKESGSLLHPDKVATFIDWLLHHTTPQQFSKQEWDIRDTSHHSQWNHL